MDTWHLCGAGLGGREEPQPSGRQSRHRVLGKPGWMEPGPAWRQEQPTRSCKENGSLISVGQGAGRAGTPLISWARWPQAGVTHPVPAASRFYGLGLSGANGEAVMDSFSSLIQRLHCTFCKYQSLETPQRQHRESPDKSPGLGAFIATDSSACQGFVSFLLLNSLVLLSAHLPCALLPPLAARYCH